MVGELEAAPALAATPERAANEKRYLKSELRFLGAPQPTIRREAKAFVRRHPELFAEDLRALSQALWATRTHELRSLTIAILEQRLAVLNTDDLTWILPFVRDARTWAHVDWLAIKVVGAFVARDSQARSLLDVWATDADFWVRRTALLAWHDPLSKGQGDFDQFVRLAATMLHEREFFIRKAIGWVLRSSAKKRPERTIAFVAAHASQLAALSFKEATRNLPSAQRKQLAALRDSALLASAQRTTQC